MKDIHITISVARQKIELLILLVSFIAANIVNYCAILKYGASMREMLTSIFYVLTFTVFLYALTVLVRIVMYRVRNLFSKRKK